MSVGREEIELFLDQAPVIRSLFLIADTITAIGDKARSAARQFDNSFESALHGIRSAAGSTASYIHNAFKNVSSGIHESFSRTFSSFFGNVGADLFRTFYTSIAQAARTFFETAIEQAGKAASAQIFLASAVRETGGTYEQAVGQAKQLARALGQTQADSKALLAQAKFATAGTGNDAAGFLKAIADLAVSRGRAVSEIPDILSGLFTSDEAIGKLSGGLNPSGIQEAYAKSIGKTFAALSDLEKKQALVNYVMVHGADNVDAASKKFNTFSGALDLTKTLFLDFAGLVGDFIARNKLAQAIVYGVRDALLRLTEGGAGANKWLEDFGKSVLKFAAQAVDVTAIIAQSLNTVWELFRIGQESILGTIFAIVAGGIQSFKTFFDFVAGGVDRMIAGIEVALTNLAPLVKAAILVTPGASALFGDFDKQLATAASGLEIFRKEEAAKNKAISQTTGDLVGSFAEQARQSFATIPGIQAAAADRSKVIEDLRKKALEGVKLLGQFDAAAKDGAASTTDAIASAAKSYKTLTESIAAATDASAGFAAAQVKSLTEASDLRKRIAEFGVIPGVDPGAKFSALIAADQNTAETGAQHARRLYDDVVSQIDGPLRQQLLVDTFKSFSVADLTKAGIDTEVVGALQEAEKAAREKADAAAKKKEEQDDLIKSNNEAIKALFDKAKASGLDLDTIFGALADLAEKGVQSEVQVKIISEVPVGAAVNDGTAFGRTSTA